MDALTGPSKDNLHLLERINISFQIQKSIVPTAVNLSQIKVAGDLPSLQVNLSDAKYHSLMRLVDVAIPKFDRDVPVAHTLKASDRTESTTRYHLPSTGLFAPFDEVEYNVNDDDDDSDDGAEDEFFEADGGLGQVRNIPPSPVTRAAANHHVRTRLPCKLSCISIHSSSSSMWVSCEQHYPSLRRMGRGH